MAIEANRELIERCIDIDHDMAVAERFGVKSIPTIAMLSAGRETERLDGLITDRELEAAFVRAAGHLHRPDPQHTGP
jgi:thioredoxin-like negative regulator of GroEL